MYKNHLFFHHCHCCLWFFLTWCDELKTLLSTSIFSHLCFSQGLWFDKDSSLQMLSCMNEDLLQSLRKRGISTVQQLLDLPGATLQAMIGNFPASRFYQVSNLLDVFVTFWRMENTQQVHLPFGGWGPLPNHISLHALLLAHSTTGCLCMEGLRIIALLDYRFDWSHLSRG